MILADSVETTWVQMLDVLVVGAGVSGLSAAWFLQESGLKVQIIEASDRVGGRTWSPEIAGIPFDLGATWIWDHEVAVHKMMADLGLQSFVAGAAGEALFDAGTFVERMTMPPAWSAERCVVGGTQQIALALAARVSPVLFETSLTGVKTDGDHLDVSTSGDSILAKHVILALPPAHLLPAIDLSEVPDERLKILRSTPTWMADIAKIVLIYERPFWRDSGLSGRAFSRTGPMQEIHDISPPGEGHGALFGFIPRAELTDSEMETAVMQQLVRLFGDQATEPVGVKVHGWWQDVSAEPDPKYFGHATLREPLMGGRLHLCSTESAAINAGHIDGAINRAREVAEVVLSTI